MSKRINNETYALLDKLLVDVELMVKEELNYVTTGKHDGIPMRDCVGQWRSMAADAAALRAKLQAAGR